MDDRRRLLQRAHRAYVEALASGDARLVRERWRDVLHASLELEYEKRGSLPCALCRAPVRHAAEVSIERRDGSVQRFPRLCEPCLNWHRRFARVRVRVGGRFYEAEEIFPPGRTAAAKAS